MISTSSRSRMFAAASPFAVAAMLGTASPAFAQDATAAATQDVPAPADAAANPNAQDQDQGSVVVTGFRAALRSATSTKKRQDQIVEAVNAEDIGKLPDNGIGESIARLPGISAQRNAGRANIISIRGFGPDFSTTTLNGREQTTTNDSRAVEFDQFPSEILNQVVVYKTSAANLTSPGIVGSIDLRTVRPLEAGHRLIAIGGRGTYVGDKAQPDSHNLGYRVYGTYVDQFAHDTLGVALSASYTDEPYDTKDWESWGYPTVSGTDTNHVFNGTKMYVESSDLKRLGLNGTVQARVSDNLIMTVDGFYSKFKDHVTQRGFEFPAAGTFPLTIGEESDGLVTSGTFNNVVGIVENYANDRDADLYSTGWNAAWDGHNGWKGFVDLSWSRTDRRDDSLQTNVGTGFSRSGASDTIGFDWTGHGPEFTTGLDYSDPNLMLLTDTQGWGWNGVTGTPINQAGYVNHRNTRDDLKEARAEIERQFGGLISSIKLGANYTDRSKRLTVDEAYLSPGDIGAAIPVPSNLLLEPLVLGRGIGPILTYDPRQLLDAGVLNVIPNTTKDVLVKPYKVIEKVFTPYAMAVLNGHFGTTELTGNIGVQAVHTDQSSEGYVFAGGALGDATFAKVGRKYWEILPSTNLALRFADDFVIRFAAAIQHMRPRMPDMANNLSYGTDPTQEFLIFGSGGNPYLKPYQVKALDLNFEKYFGSKGYIALQTFYKHMDRYIAKGVVPFDYSNLPPPSGVPAASEQGYLTTLGNTKGGYIYGAELAGTLPFEVFSPALSGFGVTGGVGYTKTRVRDLDGNITEIPGYSKWVGNLTAFYENNGFNLRGSMRYRSSYKGEFRLYQGDVSNERVLAETIFDAQVGYDFPATSSLRGLSLYVQGQNLTNERTATIPDGAPNDTAYLRYQTYGRRFLAGFTFKFGANPPPPPPPVIAPPPPPPPAPATQTCPDGTVILATDACPVPPPPPPPPAPAPERGL